MNTGKDQGTLQGYSTHGTVTSAISERANEIGQYPFRNEIKDTITGTL